MRPGPLLAAAAAIGAVPVAALLLLALSGAARTGPALFAALATAGSALALATVWTRDIRLLAETLRHAAREDRAALASAASAPLLPPVERVARGIERLSRSLADRALQVGAALRASETIVERLPDPLLVLGADRSMDRSNAAARAAFGADMPAVLRHPGLRAAIDRAWAEGRAQTAD